MKPYYEQATSENEDKDDFALVKLIKANPYLTVYDGETVRNASKRRITDISSNFGHVSGKSRDHSFVIYKTYDNGRPDFDAPVKNSQKFHSGENYVALLSYDIENVNKDYDSYCMYQLDTDTDLASITYMVIKLLQRNILKDMVLVGNYQVKINMYQLNMLKLDNFK